MTKRSGQLPVWLLWVFTVAAVAAILWVILFSTDWVGRCVGLALAAVWGINAVLGVRQRRRHQVES